MDKNEILEKSRKENQNQDERERTVRIQGESFSLIFVLGLGLILVTYKMLHGQPVGDILAMFWVSCAGSRIYRLAQLRRKSDGVTLLICLAFLAYYLVRYFTQGR